MSDSLRALLDSSPLGAGNASYVESLYEQFLADPDSVETRWREYFSALGGSARTETAHGPIRDALAERFGVPADVGREDVEATAELVAVHLRHAVDRLLVEY